MKTPRRSRQQGFTLIELITVILILGVLASVVVPRFMDISERARLASGRGALAEGVVQFNLAYVLYVRRNQHAPPNLAALSGPDYLAFGADGKVVLGDYRLTYTEVGQDIAIAVEMRVGGAWQAIAAADGGVLTRSVQWGN